MDTKFDFVYIEGKKYIGFEDKATQELLMKWSMKGQLKLQTYSYNQFFQPYQKQQFVDAFFQDAIVASTLQAMASPNSWGPVGVTATSVNVEHIPCSVTTMSLFDSLLDPLNEIVKGEGWITGCLYEETDKFPVANELRRVLLQPECEKYNIVSEAHRNEFLFRLFKHLCLGGEWCQYEDNIKPYLNTAKLLYKDIIRVQKDPDTKELSIASVVLKVVARTQDSVAYFPQNPENEQNFAYLIIDPINRHITTLVHQYGGTFHT